jgi:hypothetical protein
MLKIVDKRIIFETAGELLWLEPYGENALRFRSSKSLRIDEQLNWNLLPPGSDTAEVSLGKNGETLGIAAKLHVNLPGMDKAQADELVDLAHHFCPYSHATRNNIDVALSVSV